MPNIPAEMGVRAAWRYNKRGLVLKTAVALGVMPSWAPRWRGGKPGAVEPDPPGERS